ncbi:DUF423 domain-containing protein [Lysobacter solisilvae (ex Woo and Kim 2020)]|uniref:DUF423 domain-containing protein n=1 Tax=Agrilutibacter terrestris TaxID=2865112 RepID=A0A7H0FVM5_9GAMM|nr:DUF423 domain-containing protein [Lysobacter terrestris]QNP40091.1 DUF423 domain-containing protein [Lysobacter terrestris]
MYTPDQLARRLRVLAALGSLLAALAVALGAYAAHAAQGPAQAALYTAAIVAFGHGVALAALAPPARLRIQFFALSGLLLGTLLFSGSLVSRYMLDRSLGLAPFGGSLQILSWLLYAVASLRR